jgi:hypothetical protein
MSHSFNHAAGYGACVLLGGQDGANVLGGRYQRRSSARQRITAAQPRPSLPVGFSRCEICALVRPPLAGRWHALGRAFNSVLRRWVQ